MWVSTTCAVPLGAEGSADPLGLELRKVVSFCVGVVDLMRPLRTEPLLQPLNAWF